MDTCSYKYNAMAFWIDRIDDEVLPEYDIEQMAEALDATAQDAVEFYLETGKAPWLCSEEDLSQLARLQSLASELLPALRMAADAIDFAQAQVDSENDRYTLCQRLVAVRRAIATAEGITTEVDDGKERSLD
jgi:hypothetical protein